VGQIDQPFDHLVGNVVFFEEPYASSGLDQPFDLVHIVAVSGLGGIFFEGRLGFHSSSLSLRVLLQELFLVGSESVKGWESNERVVADTAFAITLDLSVAAYDLYRVTRAGRFTVTAGKAQLRCLDDSLVFDFKHLHGTCP